MDKAAFRGKKSGRFRPGRAGGAALLAFLLWAPVGLAGGGALAGETDRNRPAAHLFSVQLTGSPGVAFTGECSVETAAASEEHSLNGEVPFSRELTGRGLECRFVNGAGGGELTVEMRKNGYLHFRSSTAEPHGEVSFSIR